MKKASNHLRKGFKFLNELGVKDRLEVYKTMRKFREFEALPNSPYVFDRDVPIDEFLATPSGAIKRRAPQVFLSHSHADKRRVRYIAQRLTAEGIKVWIDEAEIKHGESLVEKLRDAIDQVQFVLACLSKSSIRSQWVQKELDVAMNQEIKKKKVKVIPVLLDDVCLPGFLEGKLYADFTCSYRRKKNFPHLVESLITLPGDSPTSLI